MSDESPRTPRVTVDDLFGLAGHVTPREWRAVCRAQAAADRRLVPAQIDSLIRLDGLAAAHERIGDSEVTETHTAYRVAMRWHPRRAWEAATALYHAAAVVRVADVLATPTQYADALLLAEPAARATPLRMLLRQAGVPL